MEENQIYGILLLIILPLSTLVGITTIYWKKLKVSIVSISAFIPIISIVLALTLLYGPVRYYELFVQQDKCWDIVNLKGEDINDKHRFYTPKFYNLFYNSFFHSIDTKKGFAGCYKTLINVSELDDITLQKIERLQQIKTRINQTAAFLLFVLAPLSLFLVLLSLYRARQKPSISFKLLALSLGMLIFYLNFNLGFVRYLELYLHGEPCIEQKKIDSLGYGYSKKFRDQFNPVIYRMFYNKSLIRLCPAGKTYDVPTKVKKVEELFSSTVILVLLPLSLFILLIALVRNRLVRRRNNRVIWALLLLPSIFFIGCYLVAGFINYDSKYIVIRSPEEDIEAIEKAKSAYKERIIISKKNCAGVPLTDREYVKSLAEKGNAEAAYAYSSYLANDDKNGSYYISPEARKWLKIASDRGSLQAKTVLCSASTSYRRGGWPIPDQHLQWCLDTAKHGSYSAYIALAYIYKDGDGVVKDLEKAYFWMRLARTSKRQLENLSRQLTPEQVSQLDKQVKEWKPQEPIIRQPNSDTITPWKGFGRAHKLPINIDGLACGGIARDCQIADRCGDLAGFVCARRPSFLMVNIKTKEIVSSCSSFRKDCVDLIPETWTCAPPNNMPLSKSDREKFPQYTGAINCGELLKVSSYSSHFRAEYIDKKTGEKAELCSYSLLNRKKNCQKPKGWYCDGR